MPNISVFKKFTQKVEDKPLDQILNDIKIGTYKADIEKIRILYNADDEKGVDNLKKQLLGFTASGTFINGRATDKIEKYSQIITLDIDGLSENQLQKVINLARLAPYTYASFISPRGKGVKILVKVSTTAAHHKEAYNQVVEYYEQALNLTIDTSGSDICRLCFVSYDEECFINPNADIFQVNIEKDAAENKVSTAQKNSLSTFEILERCLAFTEQKMQYFEGNRNNFIFLFASNANRFGVQESDTLEFCINNFDLNEKEIKSAVHSSYKNNSQDFAKFAKFATGPTKESPNTEKKQSLDSLSLLAGTPTIPDEVYNNLPELFKKGTEVLKDSRERDVFFTSALSIISGCLPNVTGLYGGKVVYPNLFSFLLAPPASGKGALTFAKMLADKYHQAVMSDSKEAAKQYSQEMEVHKHEKKYLKKGEQPPEAPEEPPFKVVFIPANTSNAKIIKHIQDNDGFGIICETEADTLGQTFKNDWGSYSDLLRKAYHHEKISISRKTNNEYFEIDNPRLSVVLSGTPNQILNIVQSAEDGLFSRFMFYVFASNPVWLDPSPKSNPINLTQHFNGLSDEVFRMVRFLNNTNTTIHLSDEQWEKFNPIFDEYLFRIHNLVSEDATSVVKRLGLIVYRFCMIFTAMRKFEYQMHDVDLECTDEDFNNALILAEIYLEHSLLIYKNLPSQGTSIQFKPTSAKMNFYKQLPQEFERKHAIKIGAKLTIKERTIDYHLAKLESAGYLSKPKAGYYIKVK
ncbi:DUF3987 domain-containing protein [Aequorivita echinoideorum]|uniref:DUF3987 domain-containing protein n=1 Tax=Aequorivita echinoideorum TaxID=1549647 RepID=A0ABS5S484_9FLAO|nr:DUF3987 domain-containing protein [Aequorivita echinoideorum]MBT0608027.1 DUF3987 domain-containing protein [Aequorivita echinoideorum]